MCGRGRRGKKGQNEKVVRTRLDMLAVEELESGIVPGAIVMALVVEGGLELAMGLGN